LPIKHCKDSFVPVGTTQRKMPPRTRRRQHDARDALASIAFSASSFSVSPVNSHGTNRAAVLFAVRHQGGQPWLADFRQTALLGLLAVAGYQNRDKIAEMLSGLGKGAPAPGGLGGLLGNLGAAGPGGLLGGGLKELVDRFSANGQSDAVNSWVGTGPNKTLPPDQMKSAIGTDVLEELSQQTGLSQDELLARLSRALPDAVDKYTPDGRLPA
jgi:uncharacterized protein YidB (DUF937 family)